MNDIKRLFERPLPSTRSGAFFNTFSYPTKISPESIAVYIAATTKPGDTVLDTFSGSGSTGIASLLCEHPTDRMKKMAYDLGVNPIWGSRNAIGYEIGTYGSFAAKTISNRLKSSEFQKAVVDFVDKEKGKVAPYGIYDYRVKSPSPRQACLPGVMRLYDPPGYEHAVGQGPLRSASIRPDCGSAEHGAIR